MFKDAIKIISILVFFTLANLVSGAENSNKYETGFSFSNGIFSNQSSTGTSLIGSRLSILGLDGSVNYYLTPTKAITSGLDLHLNFSEGQVGLFGVRVGYKWYYWGEGYYKVSHTDLMNIETHQRFSAYIGGALKRYVYFLSNSYSGSGNFDSSGSYFDLDIAPGADYMITNRLKATASLSLTALSFIATDDRVKISNMLVLFGFAYIF
jgi:hypothetical protein